MITIIKSTYRQALTRKCETPIMLMTDNNNIVITIAQVITENLGYLLDAHGGAVNIPPTLASFSLTLHYCS